MKMSEIPSFGNLQGVRVVCTGNNVAAPFAAYLMAENGATVITVESTKAPDTARFGPTPLGFLAERRNELGMSLNLDSEAGKDVFKVLMKNTDILVEGYKGGTFAKWGLSDEALWEVNPALSIVHVSGYGQTGEPDYIGRASYDIIGQAFGGYAYINGELGGGPLKASCAAGDYFPALFACWGGLAAYIGAQKTGKGESVDVAQYEALWKVQFDVVPQWMTSGFLKPRAGNGEAFFYGVDIYECKEGQIALSMCAVGPMAKLCQILGVGDDPQYKGMMVMAKQDPRGVKLNELLLAYLAEHTADEVDELFNKVGIPCSKVMSVADAENNPQVKARELFVEWEDHRYGKIGAVGAVPKMKARPQQYWRDAPGYNADGRDILGELGYSQEDIEKLFADGIMKDMPNEGFMAKEIKHRS
ncbi:MAG: CoA transferase [Oscillospiraceae bacterium]|nr:CoA transferase [Oscillospiraceae bacterium]